MKAQLTARQLEITELAARGRTNAELSATLGISENTVKKHLKDIFRRLGVSNRTELAAVHLSPSPNRARHG